MATPKKKMSQRRSRQRSAINLRIDRVSGLVNCTNCGQRTRPHQTCIHCGYYRGEAVVTEKIAA